MNEHGTIVVGIDGSQGATAALRVAIAEARKRDAVLKVVTVYEMPTYWSMPVGMPIAITEQEIADAAFAAAQSEVDQLLTGQPSPPKVEVLALPGSPARTLVEAAKGADLLIVGHRGRGGFSSMLIGSVGLQCVLHAPCTVTVVREPSSEI